MADVSVVVVTYDAMAYLERCLESVSGYETVVVDHGSKDGTPELVRARFPQAKLIEQENRGFGAGMNTGIRAALAGLQRVLRRRLRPSVGARGRMAERTVSARSARGCRRSRPLRRGLLHLQRGGGLVPPLLGGGLEGSLLPGSRGRARLHRVIQPGALQRARPRTPSLPRQAPRQARCGAGAPAAPRRRASAWARVPGRERSDVPPRGSLPRLR